MYRRAQVRKSVAYVPRAYICMCRMQFARGLKPRSRTLPVYKNYYQRVTSVLSESSANSIKIDFAAVLGELPLHLACYVLIE